MTGRIDRRLLDLLACPRCGGALEERAEDAARHPDGPYLADTAGLACPSCTAEYEVRGGIPVLLPPELDEGHLAEEEKLGALMRDLPEDRKDAVSEREWKKSKEEYWSFVRGRLSGGEPKTVVDVGCGIDREFLSLSPPHTIVAFDLMLPLLETLRDRFGSAHNVAGAVQALPFRDGVFDAVCCIDLVHHEPDRLDEILSSFHRILRPGGTLFLEDINARGIFQWWKSLLPRPLHGALRSLYHRMRRSPHQPAPYEFPTSVFRVRRLLGEAGFGQISAVPQRSYPNRGAAGLALWRLLSGNGRIRRFHGFHYLLIAVKERAELSREADGPPPRGVSA